MVNNQANDRGLLPYLAISVGIISLGFSPIFIRWANAPGIVTAFYRMAIPVVVMAWPFSLRFIKKTSKPSRAAVGIGLLGGALFAADLAFWATGVKMSGATNPTLLANTAPLWVGIGAMIFFHERLPLKFWLGMLLAFTGAAVILGLDLRQDLQFGIGSGFGIFSAIFYGGFFLVTQRGRRDLDALSFLWISALGSSIVLALLSWMLGYSLIGYSMETYLVFLAMGLFVQSFGWLVINYAQGHLPASLVAPTMLGQPVMTAILAAPLLNEKFTFWQIVGGIAVLLGILIVHRSRMTNHIP